MSRFGVPVPPPHREAPMTSEELREVVLMACRAMLMFVSWANRRYQLGIKLKED